MSLLRLEDSRLFIRLFFKMNCTLPTCLSMISLWRWLETFDNPPIIPRLINAQDPELVRVPNETKIVLHYFSVPNNQHPIITLPQQLMETQRMMSERQFAFLTYIIQSEVENVGYATGFISQITYYLVGRDLHFNRGFDLSWLMRRMQNPWVPNYRRTLFIVFVNQGRNRITEQDLREYFHRLLEDENCIEELHMGRIHPPYTIRWYAHVVFRDDDTINTWILHHEQDQAELWLDDEKSIIAGRFYPVQ